jgi:hypothetical protein
MEFADDEALAANSDEEDDEALADSDGDMDVEFDDFDDPGHDFLDVDDVSDVDATLSEADGSKILGLIDHVFAYVSQSAIIPYQSSILGISQVGPGPRGARGELFEYNVAISVMRDMSHLGSVHLPGMNIMFSQLIPLFAKSHFHLSQSFRSTSKLFGDAPKIICRIV